MSRSTVWKRPTARVKGALLGVLALVLGLFFGSTEARAAVAEPDAHADEAFDFMNLLAQHGLHDLKNEPWNAYGQFTYISSWKLPFTAPYTNLNGSINSLTPESERSWTGTFTAFIGLRLWTGAEAYFVPEVIAEQPLSQLRGLGGAIQNFELQKTGSSTPQVYRARAYLSQTIGLGGKKLEKTSDPMQLGALVDSRRIVLRAGNFSAIDFFDKNNFSGDLRQQYFNMAFLTYAAFDFEADARGYSWGGMAEFFYDDWALRIGRLAPPLNPNVLPLNLHFDQYYGDQVEIEHTHQIFGRTGVIRLLGYRNKAVIGKFEDAVAAFRADSNKNAAACTAYNYGSRNMTAPDLCWARAPGFKVGIGINVEQQITESIGLFFRGMISDGKSEVYAFTSTDRSISFGVSGKGTAWRRPFDVTGVGVGLGWISDEHAEYLRLGGVDGFIGDGNIRPGTESVLEAFYSVNLLKAIWLSADYQHITNPAFNRDRGPVDIFGARIHAEF